MVWKTSNSAQWHTLTCDSPTVIQIKDAWDYYYSKKCPYSNKFINDLDVKCNWKIRCTYKRGWNWRICYPLRFTRSVIWYDCVHNHSGIPQPVTLSSSESPKLTAFTESYMKSTIPNRHSTSFEMVNLSTPVTSTMLPFQAPSSKSNDAVIAGSVIGVFGFLALVLLLIYFFFKRRRADKNKDTRPGSVNNAVGQNSNVLYVVSDDGRHPVGEPPAYHSLDHTYMNDNYEMFKDLNHQDTDNYYHIHGTVIRKSLRNDDYNHTDTEAVNVSGRQRDEYNHIAVDGQSADVPTVMDDGYNHIRSTEGGVSHGIGKYNHIGGLTDGEENKGYMEDDYNHLDNSDLQNTSKRELAGNKDGQRMQNSNMSKLENNYDNIERKGGNNDGDDFEPDDTYVYTELSGISNIDII